MIPLAEFDLSTYIMCWDRWASCYLAYSQAAGHPPNPNHITSPDVAYLARKRKKP